MFTDTGGRGRCTHATEKELHFPDQINHSLTAFPAFNFYRRVEELSKAGGGEQTKISDEDIIGLFESGGPTPMGDKWLKNYDKWKTRSFKHT